MKRLLCAGVIAVGVLAAVLPAGATAADAIQYRYSANTATAWFDSWDSLGCVETRAFVWAWDGTTKLDGARPTSDRGVSVTVDKFDFCTNTVIVEARGDSPLPSDEFVIGKQLDAATLHTTVDVYDWVSDFTFPVEVNLSWSGSGDLEEGFSHSVYHTSSYSIVTNDRGAFRNADATGTVSDGSTDYAVGPPVLSQLASTRHGEMSITR